MTGGDGSSEAGKAHAAALRMLARRALFASEVAERLERKGFRPEAVAREIERLGAVGLLDDAAVARAACRWELQRGKGRRALVAALRRRGLAEELIAGVVDQACGAGEDEALAVAVARARRRHGDFERLPQSRAKVIRYLLARGFVAADVYRALAAHGGDESHAGQAFEPEDPPDVP